MEDPLIKFSSKQKEFLIKNFNLNLESINRRSNDKFNINKPFGYYFQISNFNSSECRNYEIPPPGPYQIQIQAKAISLNFRDIMIGLGLYPKIKGVPSIMGGDYAGVVIACGEKVDNFKIGDEVLCLYGGNNDNDYHFCNTINAFTYQVVLKPQHLSFQEASCIPTVFLTSYLGLYHLGNLSKNESVLIHTASGGVGLASIQIAKWREAVIFATAGNEEKRDFLKSKGIEKIMSSRSLDFYDQILEHTGSKGVDVILNTISGEALEKGMLLLNNLGRFIQIDKTDISQKRSINLDLFQKSISFIFFDLSQFFMNTRIKIIFDEVCELFNKKILHPIPFRRYFHKDIASAMNFMAMGKHIGKIVLDFERG